MTKFIRTTSLAATVTALTLSATPALSAPVSVSNGPGGGRALQVAGLQGQGINLAILGEAPTPTNDVSSFRNCFGFKGTSLKIHNAGSIKPILESSLDAMTVAMVAPKLNRLDLWVKQLGQDNP